MPEIIIKSVISTLEEVEVRGSHNLSRLLGSINALKSLLEQPEQEAADGNTD